MPNEFKVRNGLIVDSGGATITGSLTARQTGLNASGIFTGDTIGAILLSTTASNGFSLFTLGGTLQIYDNTNAATRFTLSSGGSISVNAITSSGIISIGRSTTSQAVFQRAQTPAGSYSLILASGTGIVDTFPYTMADGHGATIDMRAGAPASDQYGGGIIFSANGNTSALGEGNAIVFRNRTGTNTYTERMRIAYDGNVGIGDFSSFAPNSKLTVVTSPNTNGLNVSDANSSDFVIVPGVSSAVVRVGPAAGAMALFSANTEAVRIDTSQNVGIGTSSPASKLDVSGDINTSNSVKIGTNLQIEQRSLTGTSSDLITAATTANTTCDEAISQFANFRSMHIKYNIQDSAGGNYRAGMVMAITDGGGSITSIDTTTSDIGNTSSVVLTVVLTNSGQNMTLEVNNGLANDVTVVTEYTML